MMPKNAMPFDCCIVEVKNIGKQSLKRRLVSFVDSDFGKRSRQSERNVPPSMQIEEECFPQTPVGERKDKEARNANAHVPLRTPLVRRCCA